MIISGFNTFSCCLHQSRRVTISIDSRFFYMCILSSNIFVSFDIVFDQRRIGVSIISVLVCRIVGFHHVSFLT